MVYRIWRSFLLFASLIVVGMMFIAFTSLAEMQGLLADHLHAVGSIRLLAFTPAVVADAEDLKVVIRRGEFLARANLALALFEKWIMELDHRAARGADEMIVMGVPGYVFVVIVILAEMDAADHARFHQQLERAIDRGPRNLDLLLLHFEKKLVGLEVVMGGENLAQQGGALVRELQALAGEELLKAADFALNGRQ